MTNVKEEPCGTVSSQEDVTTPKTTKPAIDTEEPCGTVPSKEDVTVPKITEPAMDTGEPCGDNGYAGYIATNDFSWIETIGTTFVELGEKAADLINGIGKQEGKERDSNQKITDYIKIVAKESSILKDMIGKDAFGGTDNLFQLVGAGADFYLAGKSLHKMSRRQFT